MVIVEGQTTAYHGIQNDATTPNVNLSTPVTHATDDLWGGVVRRPAGCFECQTVAHNVCETEVDQSDVVLIVKQQVFGFEITMSNLVLVRVLQTGYYLLEYLSGIVF